MPRNRSLNSTQLPSITMLYASPQYHDAEDLQTCPVEQYNSPVGVGGVGEMRGEGLGENRRRIIKANAAMIEAL